MNILNYKSQLPKSILPALAVGILITISACGVSANDASNATPESASPAAGADATPSVDPVAALEADAIEQMKKDLADDGIAVSEEVWKNANGEYSPLKVAEGNKSLTTLSKKHEGGLPRGWSKADANASVEFASTFVLQEIIDSPLNGDVTQADEWIKRNGKKLAIDPALKASDMSGEESFVMREAWQKELPEYANINYRYDQKPGKPRFDWMEMKISDSYQNEETMVFTYEAQYFMPAVSDDSAFTQSTSLQVQIGIVKQSSDDFKIVGINNDYDTAPPTAVD